VIVKTSALIPMDLITASVETMVSWRAMEVHARVLPHYCNRQASLHH
jgi:hypothetical protein